MKKHLFLVLAFLLILSSLIMNVNAATYEYEDFLANYEEYDLGNKLTVAQYQINYVNLEQNDAACVIRDWGADYFGNMFNFSFLWKIEYNQGPSIVCSVNQEESTQYTLTDYGLAVTCLDHTGTYKKVAIWERDNGVNFYSDYFYLDEDVWVYRGFRFFRNGTSAKLEVYNDVEFTSYNTTLYITLQSFQQYRYEYAIIADGRSSTDYCNGIFRLLINRGDINKVDLNIYSGDEVYGGPLKPIVLNGLNYGIETLWFFEGEYSLVFEADMHTFCNWTSTGNLTVGDGTNETTTLGVNGYGTLILYMGEWQGTIGLLWFLDRMMMWIGLIGLAVCMIAPIMAFLEIKSKDLDTAFMWIMCIFVVGIPLVIGWLWG